MNAVYRFGRAYIQSGAAWSTLPPGYVSEPILPD